MLKDITLGQYFPGNSFIHRLDPRAKILLSLAYIVILFLADNVMAFALLTLSAVFLICASRLSVWMILRGLKPILFVLLFTAIINLFLTSAEGETPIFSASIPIFSFTWMPTVYASGAWRALFTAVRVVSLIIGTSIFLTYTTSPIILTDALEQLLMPLKWLHVPVHDFAMMMTIALRFIPTLIEETDKIMNAQKARGTDFTSGSLFKRAKALVPVLIPLFVSAFKRAEDLAVAMECRCYHGGEGRTKLHHLRFSYRDLIALFAFLLLLAAVILLNLYQPFGIGF